MRFQHLVSQRSGRQRRCAGGWGQPGERGPLWSPLPCAAFPAGELLQSSSGCFWGISLTRAARGSAGALEPVQLSWGLAGGDYLGRSSSVCGELSEGAEGKSPAVCVGLLQWVWAVLPVSLCPLPVPVSLCLFPSLSAGARGTGEPLVVLSTAWIRTSASSLRGLTGTRALRGTGGSSTTVFREKEKRGKSFFPRSSPPALASFPISAPCAELLALCPCCAEEAEWAWGCGRCGNCSYQAAFRQERIIIIIKSLMVPRELGRRSCPRGLIRGSWCFLSLGREFLGSLCCGRFCCVPEISRRSRESRPGAGTGRTSCRTRLAEKQGRSIRKSKFPATRWGIYDRKVWGRKGREQAAKSGGGYKSTGHGSAAECVHTALPAHPFLQILPN